MNTIRFVIPVHSFVDLITNSSSEIFTSATDSTVKAAKEIINGLLKVAGSKKRADDLFEIGLCYSVRNDATGYETMEFDDEKARDAFLESHDYSPGDDGDEGDTRWSNLVITAKDPTNKDTVAVAEALAGFFGTFNTWEQYN